jgi:hypothetical protein
MNLTVSKQLANASISPMRYLFAILIASLTASAKAEDLPVPDQRLLSTSIDPITDYFLHWFDRSEAAKASQPHWMTPITTVTPRLEQEFRYDQYQQFTQNGAQIDNYFAGKGLELIPTESNEILINVPQYDVRYPENPPTLVHSGKNYKLVNRVTYAGGFGDWNAVTIKQRILSANEENGNYILTAFLGFQAPTGVSAFTTSPAWIVTPTISGGMGWGDFDFQATLSYTLPTDGVHHIGNSLLTSVTLQYHFWEYFWPEFAFNDTQWTSGVRAGRNQLLVGPGIMFGRFNLYDNRIKFNFGIAYQGAIVPDHPILKPLTPMFNHGWILSARVTF